MSRPGTSSRHSWRPAPPTWSPRSSPITAATTRWERPLSSSPPGSVAFSFSPQRPEPLAARFPPPGMSRRFGSPILDVSARLLVPWILVFAIYVLIHGHVSPGGGFQGGVLLGSGLVAMRLIWGPPRPAAPGHPGVPAFGPRPPQFAHPRLLRRPPLPGHRPCRHGVRRCVPGLRSTPVGTGRTTRARTRHHAHRDRRLPGGGRHRRRAIRHDQRGHSRNRHSSRTSPLLIRTMTRRADPGP